jgi:phage terminase large subunit-like protein
MSMMQHQEFDPRWSTALPDWKKRIVARESLIADLPLFDVVAEKALRVFKRLRVPDIIGTPTNGEVCADWVFDFVRAVFGSYDPQTKRRMIREFFLMVPKKNGKSSIAAAIIVTAAIINERPQAELLLIAPTKQIADISFKQARGIIKLDEDLDQIFHIQDHVKKITHRNSGAEIMVKASDTDTITGVKSTFTLIDETHEFAKKANAGAVFLEIRGALASRPDGFLLQITTQSKCQPQGVFAKELATARAVRDGLMQLPLLAVLYELPPEMAKNEGWKDPKTWPMVNPNYGRSVDPNFLSDQLIVNEAAGKEAMELFASQHFNVEVGVGLSLDTWVGAHYWTACADAKPLTLDDLLERSEVATIGIDGGGLDDLLGFAVIGRERETRNWLIWTHAWAQPEVFERRKSIASQLIDFAADGDLTICTHAAQGHEAVADLVQRLFESGLLPEEEAAGLDHGQVAPILDALGALQLEGPLLCGIRQGGGLRGPIWNMELKLKAQTVRHGNQRMMNWVIGNAKAQRVGSMVVIEKVSAGDAKIDPLIAILNAAELMGRNPVAAGYSAGTPWDNDPDYRMAG